MRRLEKVLLESEEIKDLEFAKNFYKCLCNKAWYDYISDDVISFSWRDAGRFISDIRNEVTKGNSETYVFYCSGGEGIIIEDIKNFLYKNGFILFEKFYDLDMRDAEEFSIGLEKFKKSCPERMQHIREDILNKILK